MFFDLALIKEEVSLIVNSKEQIFTEKLKSLLRFGIRSTRYKDIFDFYYLIKYTKLDKKKLIKCFEFIIYNDFSMKETNIDEILKRLRYITSNNGYLKLLEKSNNNWLGLEINKVIEVVLKYLEGLALVTS